MKKFKIQLGMVNYSGEMCGTIFENSVAVVDEQPDVLAFAQKRVFNRLELLIPGTVITELDEVETPVPVETPVEVEVEVEIKVAPKSKRKSKPEPVVFLDEKTEDGNK